MTRRTGEAPMPCCETRIGMSPDGVPINYHAADCPRLDDLVMEAWLKTDEDPVTALEGDDLRSKLSDIVSQHQDLLESLWALRARWLNRVIGPETRDRPDARSALEGAASDLNIILEAHRG